MAYIEGHARDQALLLPASVRGLKNVRAELSLTALAYNLRRAITIIGIPGMIRAVTA